MPQPVRIKLLAPLAAAFLLAVISARADRLIFKNGRTLQGEIVEQSETHIKFRGPGGTTSIRRDRIERIEETDAASTAISQGDVLLRRGQYEAAIRSYRAALPDKPELAAQRIAGAQRLSQERGIKELEQEIARLDEDRRVEFLERKLAQRGLARGQRAAVETMLVDIYLSQAHEEDDRENSQRSIRLRTEAWEIDPTRQDVSVPLAILLQSQKAVPRRIVQVLRPYLKSNPDDVEAIELMTEKARTYDPFEAIPFILPEGRPHPAATPKMMESLPRLLLACFRAEPYPAAAPFDRVTCYELYLSLVPDADRLPLYSARIKGEPRNLQHIYDKADYLESRGSLKTAEDAWRELQARDPRYSDVTARISSLRIRRLEPRVNEIEAAYAGLEALTPESFPLSPLRAILTQEAMLIRARNPKPPRRTPGLPPEAYAARLRDHASKVEADFPQASRLVMSAVTQLKGVKLLIELDDSVTEQKKKISVIKRAGWRMISLDDDDDDDDIGSSSFNDDDDDGRTIVGDFTHAPYPGIAGYRRERRGRGFNYVNTAGVRIGTVFEPRNSQYSIRGGKGYANPPNPQAPKVTFPRAFENRPWLTVRTFVGFELIRQAYTGANPDRVIAMLRYYFSWEECVIQSHTSNKYLAFTKQRIERLQRIHDVELIDLAMAIAVTPQNMPPGMEAMMPTPTPRGRSGLGSRSNIRGLRPRD